MHLSAPVQPSDLPLDRAWAAVRELLPPTPVLDAPELSARLGRPVRLKLESLQWTGSFKVRGVAARLSVLEPEERRRGVVTCSSGNHGRALARVAQRLGVPARICVPEWVDPVKLEAIRAAGAEALVAGETFDEAEARALELAEEEGRVYVSAYDDPWIAAGQGTVAKEALEQLGAPPAAVVVPLSGGGLVGGIAGVLRAAGAPTRVVAVSAARARVMRASLEAGRPVELPEEETLASALAGGIGLDNRISFRLVRDWVDTHVEVPEASIARAMAFAFRRLRLVVEGGGAVGLAAALDGLLAPELEEVPKDGTVLLVISGGNVDPTVMRRILETTTDSPRGEPTGEASGA